MTTNPGFDPYAAIKELAEAEWVCNGPSWIAGTHEECGDKGILCDRCSNTFRIVPFAVLRVKCYDCAHGIPPAEGCGHAGRGCKGVGWVSERDVEKACWQVWKKLPNGIKHKLASVPYCAGYNSWEEGVLSEAEAWVKE